MSRILSVVLVLLLTGLGATFGLESWDRSRHTTAVLNQVQQQLDQYAARLSADLQTLQGLSRRLADALSAVEPGQEATLFAALAPQLARQRTGIRSVVYVDQLKISQIYPVSGNENVIGLDYGLHPEFMAKIKQMIQQRIPVVDGTAKLVQTDQAGLVFRTPLFKESAAGQPPVYRGMAAVAIDLADVLRQAGLQGPGLHFDLAIRSNQTANRPAHMLDGAQELFDQAHAQARIVLPDGDWELAAAPRADLAYDSARAWLIRGVGGVFTIVLVLLFLYRHGVLAVGLQGRKPEAGLMSLRTLLLLATLVPLPLIIGLAGWLVFSASIQTVQNMEQQRVEELAAQLRGKVAAFFEVPRAVATFNVRQLQDGLLSLDDRPALLSSLLLQLRQQPLLTYLSIGAVNGDYLAAARPPRGPGQALNILEASQADGGIVSVYRVDDANRRSMQLPSDAAPFDPRTRPWFKAAAEAGVLHWYAAYPYAIQVADGHMGIGMAVPLYDARHQLLGVLAADVALTQISQLLASEMDGLGGVAVLMGADGRLLATSDGSSVYEQHDGRVRQLFAKASASPVIRQVGVEIRQSGRMSGHRLLNEQDQRYQTNWQSIQLPDGPLLILALTLPESPYAGSVERSLQRIGLLIFGFWALGLVAVSLSAWWLSRPLQSLIRWASSLADGQWQAPPAVRSPVQEIVMLARALGSMADRLRGHQQGLEQQVKDRTQALRLANQKLTELSVTDSLTGLANRRHFDEVLEQEWHRARREGWPISLLMIDVDWFKRYNDAYGHQAGDAVLQHVGRVLRKTFQRSGDLSARYGGEEFAVIMAGRNCAAGARMAQRVCDAIAALELKHEYGQNGRVTVSVGVAEMDLSSEQAVQKLIGQADGALYRAKAAGRNRVECATDDSPHLDAAWAPDGQSGG